MWDPRLSRAWLWVAGDWPCCSTAGAGTDGPGKLKCVPGLLAGKEEAPGEGVNASKAYMALRALKTTQSSSVRFVFPQGHGAGHNWIGHLYWCEHALYRAFVCVF